MAEFTLDTSGVVMLPLRHMGDGSGMRALSWADLGKLPHGVFAQGYIEAALRSYWPTLALAGPMFAERCAFRHLAPSSLERILKDCARFIELYGEWVSEDAGRGFWIGRQKDKHSPQFPPLHVFINDAGQVDLREAG